MHPEILRLVAAEHVKDLQASYHRGGPAWPGAARSLREWWGRHRSASSARETLAHAPAHLVGGR